MFKSITWLKKIFGIRIAPSLRCRSPANLEPGRAPYFKPILNHHWSIGYFMAITHQLPAGKPWETQTAPGRRRVLAPWSTEWTVSCGIPRRSPRTRQTPDELQHNGGIRNGIVRNAGSCSNVSLSLFDVCVFWGGYLWDGFRNHGLCKQQPWSQQITKKHMLGVGTAPPNTKNHRPPISIGRALPLKNDQNHDEPKS